MRCVSRCGLGLDAEAGEFSRSQEDAGEHGAVETPGVGVAQRRVIGGEEMEAVGKTVLGSVGETVLRFAGDDAGFEEEGEVAVKGDFAEADDDADTGQRLDLCGEMRGAVANLLGEGLVAGRSAADDRGYPCVSELETVVATDGAGFAGEAELVEDGVHEVA